MSPLSPPINLRSILLATLSSGVYLALIYVTRVISGDEHSANPIWLADGFALGFWFITRGHCRWPQVIAVVLANLLAARIYGWPLSLALPGSLINGAQLALGAWLIEAARLHFGAKWYGMRRSALFIAIACVIVNGSCAVLSALIFQWKDLGTFTENFVTLFISDALGILVVTPLMVAWDRVVQEQEWRLSPVHALEFFTMLGLLVGISYAIFSMAPDSAGRVQPLFYLVIPFVLYAATRFTLAGATLAIAVSALTAIYFTMHHLGPFVSGNVPTHTAVLELQAFLSMLAIVTLFATALLVEWQLPLRNVVVWQRRYDAVIRANENIVYEIQFPSQAISWGGEVQHVLGWSHADIDTVEKWNSRIHPDDREKLSAVRSQLRTGAVNAVKIEYRIVRGDGSHALLGVSAYSAAEETHYSAPAGNHNIIGFVKDITARRRADNERARLEAELVQAQKMESIGRLAGGIAHDFNNILTSILGYGEMARNRVAKANAAGAADSALARHLDTIIQAGERGRNLVAQILTFSRNSPEAEEPLKLREVLEEVVALLRGSSPHEIVLDMASLDEPAIIRGNATALHQLFMNIGVNGLQAMGDAGTLKIVASRATLAMALPMIQNQLAAGVYLKVDVQDHGVGIDPATRQQMFEPFFTTKLPGRGTGLGLSLAMSVAKAHGGGIDVQSAPDAGATFSVYLPALLGDSDALLHPDLARGNGQRILLVDDEPGLRELAEEILVGLGYETASYESSDQALAAFLEKPDQFDAVVTDEVMPGLTGTQLASRIHATKPNLPIIIITAYGGFGFELRAQQAGVMTVLKKPYQQAELAHALAGVWLSPKR
jgi:PAS domain S-box-containing protein